MRADVLVLLVLAVLVGVGVWLHDRRATRLQREAVARYRHAVQRPADALLPPASWPPPGAVQAYADLFADYATDPAP